jgi:predicted solute-binding protein
MLANADAALVIGDAALRIAIAAETCGVTPGPDGEWLTPAAALSDSPVGAQHRCAPGRPDLTPELKSPQIHIYDIVKEWRHLTGLPAVLAIWAARTNLANPQKIKDIPITEIAVDFLASCDYGLTQIPQIAAEAANEMLLPENELRVYLEKNIDYSLDTENLKGLQRFFQESQAQRLIGPLHPINIAGSIAVPATHLP